MPGRPRRFGRKRRAAYVFRYTHVRWDGHHDRSPMLPVRLSWGEEALKTKMLLDSGATTSFILPWMAEVLGLKVTGDPYEAKGAGGGLMVRQSRVDIQVIKRGIPDAATPPRPLPVLVPSDEDALPYGVIGREPFFRWYEVIFRQSEEEVVLRRSGEGDGAED